MVIALKVMAAEIVVLTLVQVVLVQLPVLRVVGQRVRAMQIVQQAALVKLIVLAQGFLNLIFRFPLTPLLVQ